MRCGVITWLKNLLFDETKFVGLFRAVLLTAGIMVEQGQVDLVGLPTWIGYLLIGASVFIRSSSSAGVKR